MSKFGKWENTDIYTCENLCGGGIYRYIRS